VALHILDTATSTSFKSGIVETKLGYDSTLDAEFEMSKLLKVLNPQPVLEPEDQMRADCNGHWWT
jgi:hypothetical protein